MKYKLLVVLTILGLLSACDRHPQITDIQPIGTINIHQYRGYRVISKQGDAFHWYVMKDDTIKGIIVPDWFRTVYNINDTIK